ncbi:unnamed protein product [Hermetia illucens]|uniref:Uncharacterized protein n=1 Tax=Hermetia illucens TaxID=343691 RepID=A0A7R8Z1L1_HERIL|nr:unnamed protein product [Hermetia illucens]
MFVEKGGKVEPQRKAGISKAVMNDLRKTKGDKSLVRKRQKVKLKTIKEAMIEAMANMAEGSGQRPQNLKEERGLAMDVSSRSEEDLDSKGPADERRAEGTSDEMFNAIKEIREICLSKRYNVDEAATTAMLEQVQKLQKICVALLEKNGEPIGQRAAGQAAKVMRPPIGVKPAVVIQRAVPNAEKRVPTTSTEVAAMKASPKATAIEAISRKK